MSDVAGRLRELADAADSNAEFYTPSGVLAQQELETLAPALARGYADALDALADVARHDFGIEGLHNEAICRACAVLADADRLLRDNATPEENA